MNVIVIGGGIGGLTLTAALRQAGVGAVAYERAQGPNPFGGGVHLSSNAMGVYQGLGLEPAIVEGGVEIERSVFRTSAGRVMVDWPHGDLGRKLGAPMVGLLRPALHKVLLAACGDDGVRFGVRYAGFEADGNGVVAHFEDGTEERADVLVGADGTESTVRAQVLGPAPTRYSGHTSWRGLLDWEDEPISRFQNYLGVGRRFLTYPVAPGRHYWLATVHSPPGGTDVPGEAKGKLVEAYAEFPEVVPALLEATPEESILRRDIVDRAPTKTWGTGRVTLLGDAAHPMTPHQAQGACMAIEDAAVLTRHLAAGQGDSAGALRAYEVTRMPRTAGFVNQSYVIGKLSHWPSPAACTVRNAVMTGIFRTVGLKTMERALQFSG